SDKHGKCIIHPIYKKGKKRMSAIMNAMNMKHAIGVDGGGSSAMYYNGQYKVGPGRSIPNAIVVVER
ncbi:MAG: phosphodiester glycosidase family protein, partial [Patescibacteria group bacterium]